MKGLSITGLILGIVGTAAGITGVILSAIGLAKCKSQEFQNSFQTSFLLKQKEKTFFDCETLSSQNLRFHAQNRPEFWQAQFGRFS